MGILWRVRDKNICEMTMEEMKRRRESKRNGNLERRGKEREQEESAYRSNIARTTMRVPRSEGMESKPHMLTMRVPLCKACTKPWDYVGEKRTKMSE